jgi:hypothetical protein
VRDQPEASGREQEEASEGRQQEQESMAAPGLEAPAAKPPTPGRKTGMPSAPPGLEAPSAPPRHEDLEAATEDGEQ